MLTPSAALSVEQDPYIFRTLLGRVFFEYETSTREESGSRNDTNRFRQTYSLDLKGNLFSRRLIIYDAGISFTDEDTETDTSASNSKMLSYYLSTTLLPLSYTPLTLYARRSDTTNDYSTNRTENIVTNYGMNFLLKFKKLPKTGFYVDRTDRDGTATVESTTHYRLTMEQDIGPTENNLLVTRQENDDRTGAGEDSFTNTLNFTNRTLISKDTLFNFGFVASNSETDGSDSKLSALNMSLTSRPSKEFEQKHNFTTYSNETESSKITGKLYDGTLTYEFNERLSSYLTLSSAGTESVSETSTLDSDSVGVNLGINYRISTNTSLIQTVTYNETDSRSSDPTAITSDYLLIKETTTLNHTRNLSRAMLNASAGIGLLKEKSADLDGSGIEENASLSLSNIDVNKYVGFNASASNSYVKGLSGNMSGKTQNYDLSAFNKFWRRYVQMTASYKKYSQESWINIFENKREVLRFDLTSHLSRKLQFSMFAEHSNTFNESTGFVYATTAGANAYFNQRLWGGEFDSGASLSTSESKFAGNSQRINFFRFNAKYNKYLTRWLLWRSMLDSSESVELNTDTFTRVTFFENIFLFPLRQWIMSVEHRYSITDSSSQELIENKLLLKATRSFLRIF